MFLPLLAAATAQLLTVNAGDPLLGKPTTTVSDAARADLDSGAPAYCYRLGPPEGRKLACLTQAEWAQVLDDAVVIEKRWKLSDRAAENAKDLNYLRARASVR